MMLKMEIKEGKIQNMFEAKLTSWSNKKRENRANGTLGLKVGRDVRDRICEKFPQNGKIKVVFDVPEEEGGPIESKITSGFYKTCPEFRFTGSDGEKFKEWMENYGGGIDWGHRNPHKYKSKIELKEDFVKIFDVKKKNKGR